MIRMLTFNRSLQKRSITSNARSLPTVRGKATRVKDQLAVDTHELPPYLPLKQGRRSLDLSRWHPYEMNDKKTFSQRSASLGRPSLSIRLLGLLFVHRRLRDQGREARSRVGQDRLQVCTAYQLSRSTMRMITAGRKLGSTAIWRWRILPDQ